VAVGLKEGDSVFANPRTGVNLTDASTDFPASVETSIQNLTFHDLRHTFGTRLADSGVDIVKITAREQR